MSTAVGSRGGRFSIEERDEEDERCAQVVPRGRASFSSGEMPSEKHPGVTIVCWSDLRLYRRFWC